MAKATYTPPPPPQEGRVMLDLTETEAKALYDHLLDHVRRFPLLGSATQSLVDIYGVLAILPWVGRR